MHIMNLLGLKNKSVINAYCSWLSGILFPTFSANTFPSNGLIMLLQLSFSW